MGNDVTGKKNPDSPTKEMYAWRDDYGAFTPNFKCCFVHMTLISFFSRTLFKMRFVLMNKTYSELIHVHSLFTGVAYVEAFRFLAQDCFSSITVITFTYDC